MALSYNLGYQKSISVHPTRRQNFAGKVYSNFPNIWEWLIYSWYNTTDTPENGFQNSLLLKQSIFQIFLSESWKQKGFFLLKQVSLHQSTIIKLAALHLQVGRPVIHQSRIQNCAAAPLCSPEHHLQQGCWVQPRQLYVHYQPLCASNQQPPPWRAFSCLLIFTILLLNNPFFS